MTIATATTASSTRSRALFRRSFKGISALYSFDLQVGLKDGKLTLALACAWFHIREVTSVYASIESALVGALGDGVRAVAGRTGHWLCRRWLFGR
jgi:hypothetical protein